MQYQGKVQTATSLPVPSIQSTVLQRRCACGQHSGSGGECDSCRKNREGMLQRAAVNNSPIHQVPPIVNEVLRSPGRPLEAQTRAFMEPRFGQDFSRVPAHENRSASTPAHLVIGAPHDGFEQEAEMMAGQVMGRSDPSTDTGFDFSRVQIHTDDKAARSARDVNALAYTVGRDIVFGPGQYNPNTSAGAKLLAHELTHVIQQTGPWECAAARSTDQRHLIQHTPPRSDVLARQPAPAAPGWSDAPPTGTNIGETTVDEKGNILPGKATTKGVWRIPIQGLGHGHQGTAKGPAHESPKGRAVVLIPNTVKPIVTGKDNNVPVDVLLHFHGYGIGYRQLEPDKQDYLPDLKPGQVRDVELYQMEQQLLSHTSTSKRLIIAVLPQGSFTSDFGDIPSKSDDYLKEVFAKLKPAYLPEKALPGRVTVSGHSGGGPAAMAIAKQRAQAGKRTDVLLFDAINSTCEKEEKKENGETVKDKQGNPVKVCKSPLVCRSEYPTVQTWVTDRIKTDLQSIAGKTENEQLAELRTNGTRFRGYTSVPLTTVYECSYGYWYNQLKDHIETTIKKQKVSDAVRNQLRQNYQVQQLKGSHERMMGQGNLEAALKE